MREFRPNDRVTWASHDGRVRSGVVSDPDWGGGLVLVLPDGCEFTCVVSLDSLSPGPPHPMLTDPALAHLPFVAYAGGGF